METCLLILQRFFLRVDEVLFRINDTRFYHEFGQAHMIKEFSSKESSYDEIKKVCILISAYQQILLIVEITNEPAWCLRGANSRYCFINEF